MTSLPFIKNPLQNQKKLLAASKTTNKICNTKDKTCTSSSDLSIESIIYNHSDSVSTDENTYYGKLYNLLHGSESVQYKVGSESTDGEFMISAPPNNYVSGALNVKFEMYEEKNRNIPNYMKYILCKKSDSNPPYSGTIFELVRKLIDSENFLTPFEVNSDTKDKTPTRVFPRDLSDVKNAYVKGVFGRRGYYYDTYRYNSF